MIIKEERVKPRPREFPTSCTCSLKLSARPAPSSSFPPHPSQLRSPEPTFQVPGCPFSPLSLDSSPQSQAVGTLGALEALSTLVMCFQGTPHHGQGSRTGWLCALALTTETQQANTFSSAPNKSVPLKSDSVPASEMSLVSGLELPSQPVHTVPMPPPTEAGLIPELPDFCTPRRTCS